MNEERSKTSNHQRLDEMMCHLTPQKAVIPYNTTFDALGNLWVASKGGLFKFDQTCSKLLFDIKNDFPKKMAPYAQVIHLNSKIIYTCTEDKAALTEFRILNLDGTIEHEHIIDGKVFSLGVGVNGDLFMTKQPVSGCDESNIWKSHMDHPMAWEELSSTFDECFQALCVFDSNTLAVSVTSLPINMYSKQSIKWVDAKSGKIMGSFSTTGKADGHIYFPRCLQKYCDSLLVLDKTGRFQKFAKSGEFCEVSAKIDDYIGNGFTIRNGEAIIACSGIVIEKNGGTICDDWIESIRLDGSRWTAD